MTLLCWVPITQHGAQHMVAESLLWRFRLLVWDMGSGRSLVSVGVEEELCEH